MRPGRKRNMHIFHRAFLSLFFIVIGTSFTPAFGHAELLSSTDKELTDEELAGVTAQAGISINMDITMDVSYQTVAWGDQDGHSGATGAGWIGYKNLEIDSLHLWPRTDYTMDSSSWNKLALLTIDVVSSPDPESDTDHGELYGLDTITKLRIGIPTLTITMDKMTGELMLGSADSDTSIGGQVGGSYVSGVDIHRANLNQSLGSFELRGMNLYYDSGGYMLMGAHGAESTDVPGMTGSGVSISLFNTKEHLDFDYVGFSDTDNGNWIGLQGFTVDDGAGGYFSFDTPYGMPITFDVGSDDSGRTAMRFVLSSHVLPRTYSADHFIFCNQDIGSLALGGVTEGPAELLIAAHQGGYQGIDYEYTTVFNLDSLNYTYNSGPNSFNMSGVHLAGTAAGSPEDPASWSFSGKFQIGDLDGEEIDVDNDPGNAAVPNPATIDVGTDTATGNTTMVLALPMKGTARVEDVTMGGRSLGPCAIDGITVHHLNLTFSPN